MLLRSVIAGVFLLSATRGAVVEKKECGSVLEEWRGCGFGCEPTCDQLGEEVCCEVRCAAGCYCVDAHIRDHRGRCVHVQDCPSPGVLSFDQSEVSVLEGARVASLRVTRLNGTRGQITVRWRVLAPPPPYSGLEGVLKFPDGVREQSIDIRLADNEVREPDVVVTVELFEPSKKTSVVRERMRLVIKDDDMRPGYPEMSKVGVSVLESEGVAVIEVVRVGGSDGELSVQWRAVGVTAQVGGDFLSPAPSGRLTFLEGETEKVIRVQIVDDEVREGGEDFRVELFDPDVGPGVLNFRAKGTRMTTVVHIDDDDMTPGYPEMFTKEVTVTESNGRVSILVVRRGGADGEITVRWRVVPGSALPLLDYRLPVPEEGILVFPENVTEQTISIRLVNDEIKEKKELFHVELFDPRPGPGVIKFRARGSHMTTDVIIIDDDMTPGVLELERSRHVVSESVEALRVWVVRGGGADGEVRVHWRTAVDKAAPIAKRAEPGRDFVEGGGELVFKEGETRKSVLVHIVDDASREAEESFVVELHDAKPGRATKGFRGLGEVTATTIVIHDDDMHPGLLQLESSALTVAESADSVRVVVVRTGGADGEVRVHWRTTNQEGGVVESASGELVFRDGETRKELVLKVLDDEVKNEGGSRKFEVVLFDPTAGIGVVNFKGLGERTVTVVTVQDDDRSPGRLVLDDPVYEVVDGQFPQVRFPVLRVDGTDGRMRCRWKTHFKQEELLFEEGEEKKEVVIRLRDGFERKDFELSLLDVRTDLKVVNFRGLGERTTALVRLNVQPGTLDLESESVPVLESSGSVRVGVVRLEGSEGRVSVRWRTVPVTAREGSDFEPGSGELVFEDGIRLLFITVRILDDKVREQSEQFAVELIDAATDGPGILNFRGLGSKRRTVVTINDDDSHAGVFGFRDTRVTVGEGAGRVTVTVVRREGADGVVELHWRPLDGSAREGVDFRSGGQGELRFGDKELERSFTIEILNRGRAREGTRTFSVGLFDPSEGASLGTDSLVTIVIEDEEDPVRVLFHNSTVSVPRRNRIASFMVERSGDASRKLSVQMETMEEGGTAKADVDYRRTKGRIHFRPNEFALRVQVGLMQKRGGPPSVTPLFFVVRIFDPSEGEVIPGRDHLLVVITDSEEPPSKDVRIETSSQIDVEFRGVQQPGKEIVVQGCPPGMTFNKCSPVCQGVCPGLEPVCSGSAREGGCIKGCFCPRSLLLDHTLARCVTLAQCTRPPSIGGVGHFGGVSTGVQVKVDGHHETRIEQRGGVKPPPPPPPPPQKGVCPPGLTFNKCGAGCQRTCPGLEPVCPHQTGGCFEGCFCQPGMVLDHTLVTCVHPSHCNTGSERNAGGGLLGGNSGGLLGGLLGG